MSDSSDLGITAQIVRDEREPRGRRLAAEKTCLNQHVAGPQFTGLIHELGEGPRELADRHRAASQPSGRVNRIFMEV